MALVLDWNVIRPLNGTRAKGFEELCSQLARAESPDNSHFERKGTPDAGVECCAVLTDGNEWGWQAKYFHELGASQWKQIDDSVKTALEKHPRLIRYFICVPLDRPDARIGNQCSAMQHWHDHMEKWTAWSAKRAMTVEFIWWGSHELLERLARPEHVGRVHFWFDILGFDSAWFQARLDESLKTAGPRYTPEINVDLSIAAEFETFGRTEKFFHQMKSHARGIRKKLQNFNFSESKLLDTRIDTSSFVLLGKIQSVLTELGNVTVQVIGGLPFQRIASQITDAEAVAGEINQMLMKCEHEFDAKRAETEKTSQHYSSRDNPFGEVRHRLDELMFKLRESREALCHADTVAGGVLMLLKGGAGTGKTHLLCDVATQRVKSGRPTVLLMGQQFVSTEPPWAQVFKHLDLQNISAEEFVSALEAAAQAANCRALVLIDALNEGSGRQIWPAHMGAFLAHFERSPWIGVLLSVRSSYEEIIVPEEIRARAVSILHDGFSGYEYDATRTFFVHYGLELPSTPLLAPEFVNPLFLKTICLGLQLMGKRRLPRGFQGITATFDLYLTAINSRLAQGFNFNPKRLFVRQALEEFAKALPDANKRWLTLAKAEEIVNALLPGREFDKSLYRGLVSEGVLVEEMVGEVIVFISYDRFADHIIAKELLDRHLNTTNLTSSFVEDEPFSFLYDNRYVAPGLLEALCIQVPERTGQELVSLAPKLMDHWGIGDAFRQSLVWRATSAFCEETTDVLNKLIRNDHDWDDTLDVLLTVATLPEHPLNAQFLNQMLRKDSMPDRDSWWSTYLHQAWSNPGAAHRLVDWASSVTPDIVLEGETVDLCATTLAWMLSTSNRFLRDRATKSLVNLLTGRLDAVRRLVEIFTDIDDPYIAERIYAAAYGTAMRSHDPSEVGPLAACVYSHVFVGGTPPAHILLRDYARGVVERAIALEANLEIDVQRIRPPYKSQWPTIPTEDEIKPFQFDSSSGSHERQDLAYARFSIDFSVTGGGDFARYVIGTNVSLTSSDWLSLSLDDPKWQSLAYRISELTKGFSEAERLSWEKFEAADDVYRRRLAISKISIEFQSDEEDKEPVVAESLKLKKTDGDDSDLVLAKKERDDLFTALGSNLTEEHMRSLTPLLIEMDSDGRKNRPPGFDVRLIQRYILWRVFDLGWTTERFGQFDHYSTQSHGREAMKAERIGKKYQWIAFHEIMALISDHFQYRKRYSESERDQFYDGPWQMSLRDIDPSCILRDASGGTSWNGHSPGWWGSARYEHWGDPDSPQTWVMCRDNHPNVEDLLTVCDEKGTRWLNVHGFFDWRQQPPADQDSSDVERRELWYICFGYLVRAQDVASFRSWARSVDFMGRWMPEPPRNCPMFLGEYGWSPAFQHFQQTYFGDDGWIQPNHECPIKVRPLSCEYSGQTNGFDCSVDERFDLRLPASDLLTGLGLRWSGNNADYLDSEGKLATFDPTAHEDGPTALLLREDLLKNYMECEKLALCWTVLGEKRVIGAGHTPKYHAALQISGVYILGDNGPEGSMNYKEEVYNS